MGGSKGYPGQTKRAKADICCYYTPTPVITGIDPPQPIACSGRQWLTIIGSAFVSNSKVTLSVDSEIYPIPDNRTWFINSSKMEVLVKLPTPGKTWKVWVTNNGVKSNEYSFQVRGFSIDNGKEVAKLALQYWNREDVIIMTAIAAAESYWNPKVGGDYGTFT